MSVKRFWFFTIKLLLLVFILMQCKPLSAQNKDSVSSKDTLDIYKKIRRAAYKRKATILLYHAIFVDQAPKKYEEKPLSDKQKTKDPNLKYQGKQIANIYIQVFDPFGYSVNDTLKKGTNPYQKLGNKYHITTRHRIIRNLLLFEPDDEVDLLKISESERILRGARYVNDARIYIEPAKDSTDRVIIKILVHDKWTVDAIVSGSTSSGRLTLRDRNLGGQGQRYEQFFGYALPNNFYDYRGKYTIENIKDSYISSELFYATTRDATKTGISFDRPFYSPLAKWAGGAAASKTWSDYKYVDTIEGVDKKTPLDYYDFDTWLAKSYNPGTGKAVNRRLINFVLAGRYAGTRYQKRPPFTLDTNMFNVNTSLYLGSVGFSLSKYYKDQYIFRFGANEDVPEGLVVQFLYGLLEKEKARDRYYAGIDISRGKHFEEIGYFSVRGTYGTFFNKAVMNNSTLNAGIMYFTDLLRSNKWYYRQFVYFKYIYGVNKPSWERITLRSDEMYGFNSGTLQGRTKMIMNLESVTYAPYNFIGFKFAPIALIGLGMLETDTRKLMKSPLYQSYAIGVLLRNENLLTSSFEITFGVYPHTPGSSGPLSKFNPVTSFKLKVSNFSIGKPSTVAYE
ncbi:MAG: hypothetical protein M3R27_15970 [Bacteroidota bacterium]|nr:hypothetical protein [Bacteroidota bacterium]